MTNDFLGDFEELSAFGATARGGVDREAGTAAHGDARAWFIRWLGDNGFRVERDGIGNIFGLLDLVDGAPYVLAGSHLDSQPMAGRFDGAYGVLAAAHAAKEVLGAVRRGELRPEVNLAVVDWFNEEGSRFKPSMLGSAVFCGMSELDTALSTSDRDGVSVASALDGTSGRGTLSGLPLAAYAEIHVEQGRRLEDADTAIGLVTHTWSAQKLEIVVRGDQAHSGASAIADRRDALLGAAMLVVAAREVAEGFGGDRVRTAVAEFTVLPNSPVTIAREVRMLVDVRSSERVVVEEAVAALRSRFDGIRDGASVDIEIERIVEWSSGPFVPEGVAIAEREAVLRGHAPLRVPTVAGHDATNLKERTPTVMLFVPSVAGLSHNEGELTRSGDMVAGLEVFTGVLGSLVRGELEGVADPHAKGARG